MSVWQSKTLIKITLILVFGVVFWLSPKPDLSLSFFLF